MRCWECPISCIYSLPCLEIGMVNNATCAGLSICAYKTAPSRRIATLLGREKSKDGTPVLQYRERIPLPEENRDMVGVYIYSSGAIDNLRVYAGKTGANFLHRLFGR